MKTETKSSTTGGGEQMSGQGEVFPIQEDSIQKLGRLKVWFDESTSEAGNMECKSLFFNGQYYGREDFWKFIANGGHLVNRF